MDRTLHLTPDFELTEGVRLLAASLPFSELASERAMIFAFRLWVDAARQRVDWRTLRAEHPTQEELSGRGRRAFGLIDWSLEPLSGLIEAACGWPGEAGGLMRALFTAGLLALEWRGDVLGVRVVGFAGDNRHLLRDFKSIQQQGGEAKAAKEKLQRAELVAGQASEIAEQQDIAFFKDAGITPEERKSAVSLISRIDAACDRPARGSYRGEEALLEAALHRVRRSLEAEIQSVLRYLMANIKSTRVSKDPAVILRDFDTLLKYAKPTSDL